MNTLYYIQNAGYEGNCLRWWKIGGHGYTVNLDGAWRVTRDEAEVICNNRPTEDYPIPCAMADAAAQRHVSCESMREFARRMNARLIAKVPA